MGGSLVLTGRSKDTIVLSSGENIEPQPIEDALCQSPYVKFAVVVGQDCKHIGALLVADQDALVEVASSRGELSPFPPDPNFCFVALACRHSDVQLKAHV